MAGKIEYLNFEYAALNRDIQKTKSEEKEYSIKGGYSYKPSTIKKLRELKLIYPDINLYPHRIIDDAIVFYYEYVVNGFGE